MFTTLLVRSSAASVPSFVATVACTYSPQIPIRNVGFDAQFARAARDHSHILIRVPKDADKDKGEIRLLFGWAKRRP